MKILSFVEFFELILNYAGRKVFFFEAPSQGEKPLSHYCLPWPIVY